MRFVVAALLLANSGLLSLAAELAGWRAAEPSPGSGVTLVRAGGAEWRLALMGGKPFAEIVPVQDYYRRASFTFRIQREIPGPVWLSVGYLDRGYGLVSISRAVPQRDMRGIAMLNSGRVRHAVFRLEGTLSGEIRVFGARRLDSLSITGTEPPAEPLPEARPAFALKRPMDLVMSAGADAQTPEGLPDALASLRNLLPLVKALGFNGVESYVKWNFVERSRGAFDWSYYDAVVAEIEKHGLKWFPLLIVGSAYALPEWFYESRDNLPYICLEHGMKTDIPTIFAGTQDRYVQRFLAEFGTHYGARPSLLGVRLGPSANYGEAQYPATGAWGYQGRRLHTHIGYWAGDPQAGAAFRTWLQRRYVSPGDLNRAWGTAFASFDDVRTFLPVTALTPRMRLDFSTWYLDAMSEWCEKWARWAREALPHTSIYQSSGGWGAVEIGTDYAAQTKSMAKLGGGIRMTNENDSYLNNFGNTRLAASAARFYGAKFGTEPAGFSSMRGVVGRIYNATVNDAGHLFFYEGNLTGNDQAVGAWLKYAPLLDRRAAPAAEIAVYFPDTANKMRDDTLRYLRASALLQRIHALRPVADFDLVSEQMIADGALDRYKVLVIVWGNVIEKAPLDGIAAWVGRGGVLMVPDREFAREGGVQTVEGDVSVYRRWQAGETGKGRVLLFTGHTEPFSAYVRFVREELRKVLGLRLELRAALLMRKPDEVYWTVLANGSIALLNYGDDPAQVVFADRRAVMLQPYTIWLSGASHRKE
jgi:hypothetical protein